ncbi:MAG: ABC transporter ATP-binding protein [Lachnospiraceae bacterium]
MIKAESVVKRFDNIVAVDRVSVEIKEGMVFGMVGTNGAGKSTLIRMIAGVLKEDEGSITVDGMPVYENPAAKRELFYISDDAYYLNNGTPVDMADYYGAVYEAFDRKRYLGLLDQLGLPLRRKISTFSKGMKKQVSILLGVCAGTKYLLCDETFDGLDPVMRQAVKSIFAKEITERGLTPVLASHNLRELEDICDHVGLLHKGGVLLSRDLEEMRTGIHKLQCVFESEEQKDRVLLGLEIVNREQRGRLMTLTVRGNAEEIESRVAEANPVFYEMLPLTLEEIFISETEVAGYDFKKLIL